MYIVDFPKKVQIFYLYNIFSTKITRNRDLFEMILSLLANSRAIGIASISLSISAQLKRTGMEKTMNRISSNIFFSATVNY